MLKIPHQWQRVAWVGISLAIVAVSYFMFFRADRPEGARPRTTTADAH